MQKVEGSNPFSRFASNPLQIGTLPGPAPIRSQGGVDLVHEIEQANRRSLNHRRQAKLLVSLKLRQAKVEQLLRFGIKQAPGQVGAECSKPAPPKRLEAQWVI